MKNEITINEVGSVGTHQLCLPPQIAPVERTLAAAALSGQDGVVPSQNWGNIASGVLQALPSILSLF